MRTEACTVRKKRGKAIGIPWGRLMDPPGWVGFIDELKVFFRLKSSIPKYLLSWAIQD